MDPVARAEKLARAFELRRQNWSLKEISDEVGLSISMLSVRLREMIREMMPEDAIEELRLRLLADHEETLKTLRSEREMLMGAIVAAMGRRHPETGQPWPDMDAVDKLTGKLTQVEATRIRATERLAKLAGADRPIQVEHKHRVLDSMDAEIEELLAMSVGGGVIQSDPTEILEDED